MMKKLIWAVRIIGAAALLLSFPVRSLFGTSASDATCRFYYGVGVFIFHPERKQRKIKIAGKGLFGYNGRYAAVLRRQKMDKGV